VSAKKTVSAPKRQRSTGPDAHTVDVTLERDHWSCVTCSDAIFGERGRDWSIGHRRPRRMGGDPRPDTNLPSNLITLHGDGVSSCHGMLESNRALAYDQGWLLHDVDVPSQVPILHATHGWVHLTDDGRIEQAPPPINRDGVLDLGGYWDGTP
jgi:hypothetical protein